MSALVRASKIKFSLNKRLNIQIYFFLKHEIKYFYWKLKNILLVHMLKDVFNIGKKKSTRTWLRVRIVTFEKIFVIN